MADTKAPAEEPHREEGYYRRRAKEIRALAAEMKHADVRQDLLALALSYEHLAERAKRHLRANTPPRRPQGKV